MPTWDYDEILVQAPQCGVPTCHSKEGARGNSYVALQNPAEAQ